MKGRENQVNAAAKRPVFLFARQRSGTGALAGLLNAHDRVRALGEVFGDAYAGSKTHYFGWLPQALAADPGLVQPGRAAERLAAYLAFLKDAVPDKRLVLDVKFSQTHHFDGYDRALDGVPAIFRHIKALGAPVIFLRRRNLLRAYLSKLSAEQSGVWHAKHGGHEPLPKLSVDPDRVLGALRWRAGLEARIDRFAGLFPDRTELDYETLFSPDGGLGAEAVSALESVLGVTGLGGLRTDQKKLRSGTVADLVENAEALEAVLAKTKFAWMLKA